LNIYELSTPKYRLKWFSVDERLFRLRLHTKQTITIYKHNTHNTNTQTHNIMKTYKTYIRAILPLFVVLGLVGSAQAQSATSADADMTATASIVSAISIANNANVAFGQVAATTANLVRLSPTGTGSNEVGANASTGKFTVGGTVGSTFTVSFASEVDMVAADNTNPSLKWAPEITGLGTDNATSSTAIVSASTILTLADNSGNGEYFLYVGGSLYEDGAAGVALSDVAPDNYSGTLNVEVTYN
jgi:outer membrane receptor protein involved in Fe transport